MTERLELARRGEDEAAALYRKRGFVVLARNFRCRGGEIDLVAANDRTLVFCEVKTRTGTRWGAPAEAVGAVKQLRVRRAAGEWMRRNAVVRPTIRFDVVSVIVGAGRCAVDYIPDAF